MGSKKLFISPNTFSHFLCTDKTVTTKILEERGMNRRIVENYFTNQTTQEESSRVLEWFKTAEGKKYLEKRLNIDIDLMDRRELMELVPELNSEKLYSAIQKDIRKAPGVFSLHRIDWIRYAIQVAAAVLVIATASVFSNSYEKYVEEKQLAEQQPVIFITHEEENRNITLADGTEIRMNSNSEIWVSSGYLKGTREITLSGEAFFDVEHNPEQPFIIHTNRSSVEVLGTAFNVRSREDQGNVQVAVVEGRVSFRGAENEPGQEQLSVILSKNQYGYLNLDKRSMNVDDMAVENYLAWKSGWFNFEELTMQQVCIQLNRIYSIRCDFEDSEISSSKLTASFSNETLEKTLDVISMTLEVGYELRDEEVFWSI